MTASLLPPVASLLERALEQTSAARYPLPFDRLSAVWSPDRCPASLLGYLAWGLSIDLWDEGWPESTKREVCRRAFDLHRIKTTAAGIRAHVALTGSTVDRIIRPPATAHLRGAMSDADRAAWLETMPQVRIYPFAHRKIASLRHFMTGPGVHHQWHGTRYLRTSRGFALHGRYATYFDPMVDAAVELPVSIGTTDGGLVTQIFMRRQAPRRMFHGQRFDRGWLRTTEAEFNTLTVNLSAEFQAYAVPKGTRPVDVRPARIARQRVAPAPRSFFGRQFLGRKVQGTGGHLKSSHGPLLIYDRVALADATRLGARRKVRAFHGRGRFGIDPFTAEVRIKVPMARRRRRAGAWHGAGFRRAASMKPLVRAIEAIRISKAFRDRILVDTVTTDRVKFRSGLRFGEFTFGQMKEVA